MSSKDKDVIQKSCPPDSAVSYIHCIYKEVRSDFYSTLQSIFLTSFLKLRDSI